MKTSDDTGKRGELAKRLLKRAKRSAKALPQSPLPCDADQTMPSVGARVLGPYSNGDKWRLVIKEGQGRKSLVYDTIEQAQAVRRHMLGILDSRASRTVGESVEEYLTEKRLRGCVDRSLLSTRHKLLPFLPAEVALASITPAEAERLYLAHTPNVAVATHHHCLRYAKAFFGFCVKKGYVTTNPFSSIQAIGKANAGKPQLRIDEAKRLTNYLLAQSENGDTRALALVVQLLLGLRSSEVLKLKARDIDCGGTVVVVDGTKTKNAKRALALDAPEVRALLVKRCASLQPEELVFGIAGSQRVLSTTSLHKSLGVYCKRAGVPRVCPHSLRGLHSSLAVTQGATPALVAQALGHGSDAVTRKHYIESSALDSARASRVSTTLLGKGLGDLDTLVATLRALSEDERDRVCSAVGYRR